MTNLMIFKFLLLGSTLLSSSKGLSVQGRVKPGSPICLKSGCQYVSNLEIEPEDENEYKVTDTELGVMSFKEAKASVYELLIQRKYRFCRYSVFGDNRGCEEWKIENIKTTREEIIQSVTENSCLLGRDCIKGRDCWGKDAMVCQEATRDRRMKLIDAPKTHPEMTPWENFFYDTCEQSWTCEVIETRSTLQFGDTVGQSVVLDLDGKLVGVNYNHYTYLNDQYKNRVVEPIHIKAEKVPAVCVHNGAEAFCRKKQDSQSITKSTLFVFKNKCSSDDHAELITLDCNKIRLSAGKTSSGVLSSKPIGASASIGDLRKLNEMLRYESMETVYNVKILQRKIWDIKNMIIKMVMATSESNPYFLGALLDKPSYTTVFGRKIRMCPCFTNKDKNQTSKCVGPFISKGNIWVSRKPDDFCPTQDIGNKGKPLFLFKDEGKLELQEMPTLDFESSDDLSLILKNSHLIGELMSGDPLASKPSPPSNNDLFFSVLNLWEKLHVWILWGLVILNTWTLLVSRR